MEGEVEFGIGFVFRDFDRAKAAADRLERRGFRCVVVPADGEGSWQARAARRFPLPHAATRSTDAPVDGYDDDTVMDEIDAVMDDFDADHDRLFDDLEQQLADLKPDHVYGWTDAHCR